MKFLVVWNVELARVSTEMMKAVLTMRDYATPWRSKARSSGATTSSGPTEEHGSTTWTPTTSWQMLLARSPVYNFSHFKVYPLADMTALPLQPKD